MSPARAVLANPMLAAAVECARHGLPVYPARVRDKAPLYKGWQKAATTKPEHLVQVWQRAPGANIGIACRNIAVLDADSARGVDAVEELGLPATTTVRTHRGNHYYFVGRSPTVPNLLAQPGRQGRRPDFPRRDLPDVLKAAGMHRTGPQHPGANPSDLNIGQGERFRRPEVGRRLGV